LGQPKFWEFVIDSLTIFDRLKALQSRTAPGDFLFLASLVDELGDVGEHFDRLAGRAQADALLSYAFVASLIDKASSESHAKLMLQDIGSTAGTESRQDERNRTVSRALHTSDARWKYLTLATGILRASLCVVALGRQPLMATAWRVLARAALDAPTLGLLAHGIDIRQLCMAHADEPILRANGARALGIKLIELNKVPEDLLVSAGGELVKSVNCGFTPERFSRCLASLKLLANFLTRTEGRTWTLSPIVRISTEDSLTLIVRELLLHRLRRLRPTDAPLRELVSRENWQIFEDTGTFYLLRKGIVGRERYIVTLPGHAYLSPHPTLTEYYDWEEDPRRFLKHHVREIARSAVVSCVQLRLARLESLQMNQQAQKLVADVLAEATTEGFALAGCRLSGLPDEAIPFIAATLRPFIKRLALWT